MSRRFFDTNILVYAFDDRDPSKRQRAHELLTEADQQNRPIVSTQVLQEFFWTTTRKLPTRLPVGEARAVLLWFMNFEIIQIDVDLILDATSHVERMSVSFWDALVISSALFAGSDELLSEDMQNGQVIDGMRIVNPFAAQP